jgi:hypothetical protein
MSSVPVSLMPIPHQQFLSSSGTPLAGGFVYTYVAGTNTPAPTYLDYTGTSQNTNPITLDAGGFASIWIPAGAIDVAVFNSSNVQQYKVLSVTALPSTVTSLTAGYFQSSTPNPALSGTIRLANTDTIDWRNSGNSADLAFSVNSVGFPFFNTNPFAFLTIPATWPAQQIFASLGFTGGTPYTSLLANSNTNARTYTFPDSSGTVLLSDNCIVTNPVINGVTISGAPTGAGQSLVSTSPTAATWGIGSILDYDNYTGLALLNNVVPATGTLTTIPAGGVEQTGPVGSYIEGELVVNNISYTGSAPVFSLLQSGNSLGSFTMSSGVTYDIRFSLALSSNKSPQSQMNVFSSAPGIVYMNYGTPGAVLSPTPIGFQITGATTITLSVQFIHVRVRN